MNTTISNELLNLFNLDKIDNIERIKVNKLCNDLVGNTEITSELNNNLNNLFNKDKFNLLIDMPVIIKNILDLLERVEYYKSVKIDSGRMKYILYCIMVSFLYSNKPEILEKVEINDIRSIYFSVYDLVILIPQDIKKYKCSTCLFNSFKILNRFNSKKIIL